MSAATVSLSILAAVVVLFVWNRLPVELVAVGAALALFFSGVLTLDESLAGFGDPAVILIAALFVVSEGLDATGVTTWLGRTLVEKSGGQRATPARFHHVAQRGPHRADRAERNGGCTAAHGGDGRRAARLPDVAAAHAACLRRQRGRATAPDRKPGERGHLGGRRGSRESAPSASRSSPWSGFRWSPGPS